MGKTMTQLVGSQFSTTDKKFGPMSKLFFFKDACYN